MQNIESLRDLLESPKNIVIVPHSKPDADALGSSLGLGAVLLKKQHKVNVISPTDYPEFLNWMKGNDEVLIYSKNSNLVVKTISEADIIFNLDYSSLDRTGSLENLIRESEAVKVLIDHHLEPEDFADIVFWDIKASATAELVYQIIKEMGDSDLIDIEIGEMIYAGIMTDTGNFRHNNTSIQAHRITAELIEKGIDVNRVSQRIYDNNSLERIQLTGFALSQRIKVLENYNTAYIYLSIADLNRFNYETGDTEGLVNYALSIKGIVFAALIIEGDNFVKFSFRSSGDFSVNDFARTYFNGGGHKNAAGGISDKSLKDAISCFEQAVSEYKASLSKSTEIRA